MSSWVLKTRPGDFLSASSRCKSCLLSSECVGAAALLLDCHLLDVSPCASAPGLPSSLWLLLNFAPKVVCRSVLSPMAGRQSLPSPSLARGVNVGRNGADISCALRLKKTALLSRNVRARALSSFADAAREKKTASSLREPAPLASVSCAPAFPHHFVRPRARAEGSQSQLCAQVWSALRRNCARAEPVFRCSPYRQRAQLTCQYLLSGGPVESTHLPSLACPVCSHTS